MYILHEDGHMTFCQYSTDVESTECQDPSPYGDNRAGREKEPWIFMDSRFELMQQTKLPNAAIYILDGANRSIDKFSYQMNLEKAIKAQVNQDFPVPDMDPTGFGITSDMEVFLAFENQLFIAPLK
jgi:adenine-specific DNA methylase